MAEYIEREAAYESLLNGMVMTGYQSRALDCISEFFVPAADVAPVRRGRWMKSYADHEAFGVRPFFRYCSECNEATVHQYSYCPNCGARMDGDANV